MTELNPGGPKPIIEMFRDFPKINISEAEIKRFGEWKATLATQSETAATSLRKFDLQYEIDGANYLFYLVNKIGGLPETSEAKKLLMIAAVKGIGGWPDRLVPDGETLSDWRARYHRYLGLTEACRILGWRPEDQGRTPDEVFNYLGGETQRAMYVNPESK